MPKFRAIMGRGSFPGKYEGRLKSHSTGAAGTTARLGQIESILPIGMFSSFKIGLGRAAVPLSNIFMKVPLVPESKKTSREAVWKPKFGCPSCQ